MALGYESPPRKEGDSRWAQEYLLDPLNAVEAYQTAQTGGLYNDKIPTQHRNVTTEEYYNNGGNSSGSSGIGRTRSLLGRSKAKENKESEESGVKRSNSIRNRLIRRFTDDSKSDHPYTSLRPLNEISDKEVSRMANTDASRSARTQTPIPDKTQANENRLSFEINNQENIPVVQKKPEDRYSNNPFRDSMIHSEVEAQLQARGEIVTPPRTPVQSLQRTGTNPFRRGSGNAPPSPQTPPRYGTPGRHSPLGPHPQGFPPHRQPHPHSRTMPRSEGPRSPHRQRHRPSENRSHRPPTRSGGADTIDNLDTSFMGLTFHHEGPYDATLRHRNRISHRSPLEATKHSNMMALRATAPQDIENSLRFGRPLDGVAIFPPGSHVGGQVLDYDEYDLNRKDGNYRRYPGMQYRDEDLKGKGIEGYDGDLKEKQEKEAKHRRGKSLDALSDRSTTKTTAGGAITSSSEPIAMTSLRRNGSTAGRLEGAALKIKRTFSIKRKEKRPGDV